MSFGPSKRGGRRFFIRSPYGDAEVILSKNHNGPIYDADGNPVGFASLEMRTPPPRKTRGACAHRGGEVKRVNCKGCKGLVRVLVFSCQQHGLCTIKKNVGEKVCHSCPEYRHEEKVQDHPQKETAKE